MRMLTRQIIRTPIKKQVKYILLLVLAAWAGCKGPKVVADKPSPSTENPLTLILSDFYGGAEQEELRVIRNEKELAACFSKINMSRKPGLPVPEIDFDQSVILIYSPGRMQYTELPKLELVGESDSNITVRKTSTNKFQESDNAQPIIQPFMAYELTKTSKHFILIDP